MSKPAIVVENLSKSYRLGLQEQRHQSFGEALASIAMSPLRRLRQLGEQGTDADTFWALRDVNFSIQPGEVVGIVGRNGAGKSTLLKVLSRIVEPTSGRIKLRGRVASLLEVGTGFHPELSGRENIYMNGSILGMRKTEIDRKFDEIVAFAEVEKFLDTPVKRYSSGMYVRLAFAVAAHLEPEILIVDEVLAVGDAEFQKKCLGKMQEVSGTGGRTVLFVSHNMAAVRTLTDRCVWLDRGQLRTHGMTSEVLSAYMAAATAVGQDTYDFAGIKRHKPDLGIRVRIQRIAPVYKRGDSFELDADLVFDIRVASRQMDGNVRFGVTVLDVEGVPVLTTDTPPAIRLHAGSESHCEIRLPHTRLAPGNYQLALSVGEGRLEEGRVNYDVVNPGPTFQIGELRQDGSTIYNWIRAYGSIVGGPAEVRAICSTAASAI